MCSETSEDERWKWIETTKKGEIEAFFLRSLQPCNVGSRCTTTATRKERWCFQIMLLTLHKNGDSDQNNHDIQGVPINTLSECCWSHSSLAQSPFADTPCVWRLIFCSFLTKTKQDQAPPSHVNGKIQPHRNQFWL